VIEFRALAEDDLELVAGWLAQEHVRTWWREPIADEIAGFRAGIAGSEPTDHYLAVVDGRPVGLLQAYLVSDYPEWEAVVGADRGAAGLDILIGEPDMVGRGLGPRLLAGFVREIVFARPETRAAVATVEQQNRRSWRAFEKAGFRHVRDVLEDGIPSRLLRLDR
jgi:aminoglycoside 6'-N-acetyltransferase